MTSTLTPTLHRSRELLLPAMRSAVAQLDPASHAAASYHLGWTDAVGAPSVGGGKALRPALALLSAELAGASAETAIPGAVAVELVHNFSLLHDDVMDGDTQRRHRATVWSLWGEPCAILTGDALLVLAQQVLLDSGSRHAPAAARLLLLAATQELVRGQVEDLAFETRSSVSVKECVRMAAGKTAALLSASTSIGAVLAGAPHQVVSALSAYGQHLGAAFQLVDDLLGIWGDPAVTGKPVLSDLRSKKKTLPVSWVLAADDASAHELAAWYTDSTVDEVGLHRAAELVEAGGGRGWATAEAARRMRQAELCLDTVELPPGPRAELLALGRASCPPPWTTSSPNPCPATRRCGPCGWSTAWTGSAAPCWSSCTTRSETASR